MYPSLWQQVSLLYNVLCSKYVKMTKTALGIVGKWQGEYLEKFGWVFCGPICRLVWYTLVLVNIDMQLTEGF